MSGTSVSCVTNAHTHVGFVKSLNVLPLTRVHINDGESQHRGNEYSMYLRYPWYLWYRDLAVST